MRRYRDLVLLAIGILACLGLLTFALRRPALGKSLKSSSNLQSFSLVEQFGVGHPQQVIDFDYSGAVNVSQSYMLNSAGVEVPFQQLSNGHIAVQTDLPANATRSFRLSSGRAPSSFANTVTVRATSAYYEISNGLTGVRITRPDQTANTTLAPIQGVQLRDSSWTATGPNYLYPQGDGPSTPLPALSAAVKILEQGPLQFTAQVTYAYNRPALYYGNDVLIPAGAGHYYSTITVQAGQPSVLIEDETDMDLQYFLNVYGALQPDHARYRGHDSTSVENGWDMNGNQYPPSDQRGEEDATRALQYNMPGYSSYFSGYDKGNQYLKRMATWDPWASDTGWYYMLYNEQAGSSAPVLGTFAGNASRALGVVNSGVGAYTLPNNGRPQAGFNFQSNRRDPSAVVYPLVRVSWGLFVGTKGTDLTSPYQVQNINRQMNLHGGINLNKIYRLPTNFPDPPANPLYMSTAAVQSLISRVRSDDRYYNFLYTAEPTARPLLDSWRDSSGNTARALLTQVQQDAQKMLNSYVNGTGIYSFAYQYWMGGLIMSRDALFLNDLACCESGLSATDKSNLKPVEALFADLLWDNDLVPLFTQAGVNLGTENMPVQEAQYRSLYALMLPTLPFLQDQTATVAANVSATLAQQINDWGAEVSSPHYAGPSLGPVINLAQQLQTNAGVDYFQSDPHLARFAEFYLNLLTPPEVRFGGLRKLISVGDGATEGSELFGELATGLAPSNPALSARLMGAWKTEGQVESGFFGTTVLEINDQLPAASPLLASATFPGWCSVLRYGFDTPNETALWLINGDFYRDHRHEDLGSLVLYALGAPLALDWGSMYSPGTPGAYLHSAVLPETSLGQNWNDDVSLDPVPSPWHSPAQNLFLAFDYSSAAVSSFLAPDGTSWTRSAYNLHPNASYPVIELYDTFAGPQASAAKVFSMNLMSQPTVQTPAGNITPNTRFYDGNQTDLPSGGSPFALAPGLSRFHFTGQWLIDWDLYSISSQPKQALLGNWGHNWAPENESDEFQAANGNSFQETQDILRLRGTDPFQTLILPYRKTASRNTTVNQNAGTVQITSGTEQTQIGNQSYSYSGNGLTILTTFGAQAAAANSIQISGGPTEVAIANGRVSITAHGTPGTRTIILPPGSYRPVSPLTGSGNTFTLNYSGADPLKVVM